MYQNATEEQIAAVLRAGGSVSAVSRELRADKARIRRIRDELGLATFVPAERSRSLEEKWAASTRPVGDGHLEWTGERGSTSGTPVMRHREQNYSPAAVAFRIRTGRDADGQTFAECGMSHCVAPDHVRDETERAADRAAKRSGAEPDACRYGHSRAVHGRYEADGTAYCQRCKWLSKNPEHDDRIRPARPQSAQEAFGQLAQATGDGHVLWTGPTHRGTPGLPWQGTTLSPLRMAFRLHHGREPEGIVRSACTVPYCVAGPCLQDRPMRIKTDRLFKSIFGTAA
jgi:hypothetical protein